MLHKILITHLLQSET